MARFSLSLFCRYAVLVLLILPIKGFAQYYSIGADPSSIRWQQSKVQNFKLIFPEKEVRLATKFSRVLNDITIPVTASMKADLRGIPIIMHPYTSFSNGSSILAPRRIELFPKQPIALETSDFIPQLVIHEVRHFAQMERLNVGFTKYAGYLLGEQAQSLVLGLHVPTWLLEGDAVLTETLLSNAGRGRIAGFVQPLRSRLIDHKDLSWDLMLFGSYNDLLPDEYLFGYFIAARGRMLTNPMLWSDALRQIGGNPFIIKGVSGLTRTKTGYGFSKLFVETMDWLYEYWTNPSLTIRQPNHLIPLIDDSVNYKNYYRPQWFDNHKVISLKKSLNDVPAFVVIDSSENERILTKPGYIEDAGFTFRNGKLIWAELVSDPRWQNRSWSELFVYDVAKDRKSKLTRGKRLFSPTFNPDGNQVAVIVEESEGSSWLQVLNITDGNIIHIVNAEDDEHFSYLCWGQNSKQLIAITTGPDGRKLKRITLEVEVQEVILNAGYADITSPAVFEDWIYFAGPDGATQGLFRINAKSLILERVFSHPHGINYLTAHDQELFLSTYSSNGYRPAKIAFKDLKPNRINRIKPLAEPVTTIIQRADGEFPLVISDTLPILAPTAYNKIFHLFRLHSWSPLFVNPDAYQISPGIVFMSQNDLSTLTSWAGYQFNKPDLSHNLIASARYTGFYPILELDYRRKYLTIIPENDPLAEVPSIPMQFFRLGTSIPLDFSSGAWKKTLQPGLFVEHVNFLHIQKVNINGSAWMTGASVSSQITHKLSYRDLFPKWGVLLDCSYFKAFSKESNGNNLTGRVLLYMPGFLPNSSLRIYNSTRLLTVNEFTSSLMQDFPRGLITLSTEDYYNLKIDYAFPIAYPDYHLSWLIFVKRIKANLFFDAGTPLPNPDWFTSTGVDVTMDYHIFRLGIELGSGVRTMFFPTTRKFGAEFLFSFSVN